MSNTDNFISQEFESNSEEDFSRLLEAYQSAVATGTLSTFWENRNCSDETKNRLHEIASTINDIELYFSSAAPSAESIELDPFFAKHELPGFTLTREIGRGSNGTVYLAFDTRLNRNVAVKIPNRATLDSFLSRQRFQKEAELAASVDHPHILPIYKIGSFIRKEVGQAEDCTREDRDIDYIISAYCPGPNLRQWLDMSSTALSVEQATIVILRLSEGLECCHGRNILHRDIKPANVMLFPVPCGSLPFWPKLTDFGLAKDLDKVSELTTNNELVGTPRYMAKEQISKTKSDIGTATDVYALGAMLYELLAGCPPFNAENLPSLFDQIRNSQPKSLRSIRREIPRNLERICFKCLQKNPLHRYPSAKGLKEDLQRFLEGKPILANEHLQSRSLRIGIVIAAMTMLFCLLLFSSTKLSQVVSITRHDKQNSTAKTLTTDSKFIDGYEFAKDRNTVFIAQLPKFDSSAFTIEAWIYPKYPRGMILNCGGILSLFSDNGQVWAGPSINLMMPNQPIFILHSETTLTPGEWSHIACVFDGRAIVMFINGKQTQLQVHSEDSTGKREVKELEWFDGIRWEDLTSNKKLVIGGNFPSALETYLYPFNGNISEVRISAVDRYSNNFIPTRDLAVDSDTLSLYHFDATTGSKVIDRANRSESAIAQEQVLK